MSELIALTVFQGHAGDRNDLAAPGALALGALMAQRMRLTSIIIGEAAPALNKGWQIELAAALPTLLVLAQRIDEVFASGKTPLTVNTRCAASLATLPVVARRRLDACIVWFDAHADFNTPSTSATGYLGGMAISGPAGLWDSGLGQGVNLSNVVLVGARDFDPAERDLIDAGKLCLVPPGPDLAHRLHAAIGGRPAYVHLDCDVLNPGIVPTDFVVEGGISLEDLRDACAVIAGHEVIGLEVAEFQGAWQAQGPLVSPAPLFDAVSPLLRGLCPAHSWAQGEQESSAQRLRRGH